MSSNTFKGYSEDLVCLRFYPFATVFSHTQSIFIKATFFLSSCCSSDSIDTPA